MGRISEKPFSHSRHIDGQQAHEKMCSASLITKEIQVRTTVSYHLTPVRITITKRQQIKSVGEGMEKGTLIHH